MAQISIAFWLNLWVEKLLHEDIHIRYQVQMIILLTKCRIRFLRILLKEYKIQLHDVGILIKMTKIISIKK